VRGLLYGGSDYFQAYEKQIVKVALIETIKGVENMRAIAATPGLDMIYVGPNDLTIDFGGAPTYIASDPRVIKAMEDSIAIARENGIVAGTYAGSVDVARAAVAKGFGLVSVGYAATLLMIPAGMTINPALYSKLSYNLDRDFEPVVLLSAAPLVLAINPSPVRSVKELVAFAKARPGSVRWR
jgi:hypothetical protein